MNFSLLLLAGYSCSDESALTIISMKGHAVVVLLITLILCKQFCNDVYILLSIKFKFKFVIAGLLGSNDNSPLFVAGLDGSKPVFFLFGINISYIAS